MEECAGLCSVGSSWGCRCGQQYQGPAETAAAEAKRCPQKRHRPAETAAAEGKQCRQKCQGPAEMAAAKRKPAPAEKHVEADPTARIWRRRCREEFGIRENLENLEMIGMSYREVYAQLFPYRHILGLWQLDTEGYRTLLNVVVDGLCITGWTYGLSLNTHVDGPLQFKPGFRIRLTERKPATVECLEGLHSRPHHRHMQIQKDRLTLWCNNRDHRKVLTMRLRGERGRVLVREDRYQYDCLTYRRLYLPPSHLGNLIRPGLFQGNYDVFGLMIAMLSFHGKYARVTKITGNSNGTLEIHLMRRIPLPGGEIFRNFNELSHVVQEIDEQVIREQQQQQQQENGTEESEGHGWQNRAQPSVGESGAAASEEQPVPFVLPEGVRSRNQNYPGTCRMCFYAVDTVTSYGSVSIRFPGVFILFDENHFGFICLEVKYFILFSRVQNTFQNVEAPSPQAFLEMLKDIHSRTPGRSSLINTDEFPPNGILIIPIAKCYSKAAFWHHVLREPKLVSPGSFKSSLQRAPVAPGTHS
ncbi:F-box only protein 31-like [Myotis lucifugus]|uniref:F-box only protein 31-like n=1 Tax=Myotis lucifugus TaxID=59463 RepID=UPI000CCC8BDF|nr:F-box only protein 31-like [Myotis lucifugus]